MQENGLKIWRIEKFEVKKLFDLFWNTCQLQRDKLDSGPYLECDKPF